LTVMQTSMHRMPVTGRRETLMSSSMMAGGVTGARNGRGKIW
jgi:hypothetical protein